VGELHSLGAGATLITTGLFGLFAAGVALTDGAGRAHGVLRSLRIAIGIVVGLEAMLGVILFATGQRPAEGLHLLYGLAILGVIPLAASLTAEAPPRPRAAVLAVAAVVQLLLVWRLYTTG